MSEQTEMAQAIRRQMDQSDESMHVDRTGWTRQQWIEDARERFEHIDGAVTSLVNGHIEAMLAEIGTREDEEQGPQKHTGLFPSMSDD